jgi:hypothetical protein
LRIWSLHPKYLDTKGLVALWRESLLAKNVLEGKTRGYKNHPQLNRFKNSAAPLTAINLYLFNIHKEACSRQYNFDSSKFTFSKSRLLIPVTEGQINYEITHLLNKLEERDQWKFKALKKTRSFDPHPLFTIIEGDREDWEVVNSE